MSIGIIIAICATSWVLGMPVFSYFQSRYWDVDYEDWEDLWDGKYGANPGILFAVLLWPVITPIALFFRAASALVVLGTRHREESLNPEKERERPELGPYR